MQKTYAKIARGVELLATKIGFNMSGIRMPIGLDGAIVEHLFHCYCDKYGLLHTDNLHNTVGISSRSERSDIKKFDWVLYDAGGVPVEAVDLRTQTRTLANMVRQFKDEWENKTGRKVNLKVLAMYDKNKYADGRIYEESLTDADRLLWYPTIDHVNKIFYDDRGSFRRKYCISHETLDEIPHVQEIKKLI